MSTLYTIRNWDDKYENSGSRKLKGALDWFSCPTKHDGLSYRRLMRRADAVEMYGAWILISAVAAKCKPRGTLQTDDETPFTAEDIAMKTGAPEETIKRALELFSSKELGWLIGRTSADAADVASASADVVVLKVVKVGHESIGQESKPAPASQAGSLGSVPESEDAPKTSARKPPVHFTADDFTYPASLDTPECRAAIETWLKHKRDKRQSYKTTTALNVKLEDLARDGPAGLVAAVRHSIGNDYDGLYQDKNFKNDNRPTQTAQQYNPLKKLGPV